MATGSLQTLPSIAALRDWTKATRAADRGGRIALVPTMGALHRGHLSLIEIAKGHADHVLATIFVNPTQFGPSEDFDAYPRDAGRDLAMLAEAGCDAVFTPAASAMYPPGFATEVRVTGLSDVLCGAARPGHFDGVAQVVTKLLNQARADIAVFGEKDWQQLAIIRRLALDLDMETAILGAPTRREGDGLAMSSRNRYLTAEQRAAAPALFAALSAAAAEIAGGRPADQAAATARDRVLAAGFAAVDYLEARDQNTLAPLTAGETPPARIFAAAHLGAARLIDNVAIPW